MFFVLHNAIFRFIQVINSEHGLTTFMHLYWTFYRMDTASNNYITQPFGNN